MTHILLIVVAGIATGVGGVQQMTAGHHTAGAILLLTGNIQILAGMLALEMRKDR